MPGLSTELLAPKEIIALGETQTSHQGVSLVPGKHCGRGIQGPLKYIVEAPKTQDPESLPGRSDF